MTYYDVLGVLPNATQTQIRDAYRRKSKQYHPDTTTIEKTIAAQKFQAANQAYDTLRFAEKRQAYDAKLLQQRKISQVKRSRTSSQPRQNSAFLAPEDRPLSAGELFALFILGLTFLFCLLVALFLGISRGEMLVNAIPSEQGLMEQLQVLQPDSQSGISKTLRRQKENEQPNPDGSRGNSKIYSQPSKATKSKPKDATQTKEKKQISLFPSPQSQTPNGRESKTEPMSTHFRTDHKGEKT